MKTLYANVYEQGQPREMAIEVAEDEKADFIRRQNNLSQEASLQFATKEINFFEKEKDAKNEYWDRIDELERVDE